MNNIHNTNDLNQQVSNYMNIIRDSRFLINNIINMLQPDNYNESNNDIINNILNIMNNQNTTFLQYINYNIEVERLNVERQQQIERQQNRQYQLDRDRIRNRSYNNYYNRIRPRQSVGRTTSNRNSNYDDIIHILFTNSNTNSDGDGDNDDNNVNLISPAQINIATEIMKFTDLSDDIKTNQTRCPISYHDFVNETEIILIKHCKHIFKKQSLLNWFLTSKCCPMCRYDLTTYTENNIGVNNTNENQT
jgi:hypothetical protein